MRELIEMVGSVYGKWTVIEELGHEPNASRRFLCQCQCGATANVTYGNLRSGQSTQCRECANRTQTVPWTTNQRCQIIRLWRVIPVKSRKLWKTREAFGLEILPLLDQLKNRTIVGIKKRAPVPGKWGVGPAIIRRKPVISLRCAGTRYSILEASRVLGISRQRANELHREGRLLPKLSSVVNARRKRPPRRSQ